MICIFFSRVWAVLNAVEILGYSLCVSVCMREIDRLIKPKQGISKGNPFTYLGIDLSLSLQT